MLSAGGFFTCLLLLDEAAPAAYKAPKNALRTENNDSYYHISDTVHSSADTSAGGATLVVR